MYSVYKEIIQTHSYNFENDYMHHYPGLDCNLHNQIFEFQNSLDLKQLNPHYPHHRQFPKTLYLNR